MNDSSERPKSKRYRWRRVLVTLAVLAVLYASYRLTLHLMVEVKLNEIRKQGATDIDGIRVSVWRVGQRDDPGVPVMIRAPERLTNLGALTRRLIHL